MFNGTRRRPTTRLAGAVALVLALWTGSLYGRGAAGQRPRAARPPLEGPYLGQTWVGPNAELFAPDVVSTGLMESAIAMTPDGRACYFDVMLPPALSVIVETRQVQGVWTEPEIAPFSRGQGDSNPAVSPDGQQLFFVSARSLDGGPRPASRSNPWVVDRAGGAWSAPRPVEIPIGEKQSIMNVLPVRDGSLYLTLREGRKETICRTRRLNGRYLAPEPLPPSINSVAQLMVGSVAPDEHDLLFSAFDAAGSLGGSDLYVSFRGSDGEWGAPINLGPTVNTADNEFSPSVSPDGRFVFFSRFNQRPLPGADPRTPLTYRSMQEYFAGPQNGLRDIFWVGAVVLDRLRILPHPAPPSSARPMRPLVPRRP